MEIGYVLRREPGSIVRITLTGLQRRKERQEDHDQNMKKNNRNHMNSLTEACPLTILEQYRSGCEGCP